MGLFSGVLYLALFNFAQIIALERYIEVYI